MTRKILVGTFCMREMLYILIGEVSKVSTAHETIHLKYGISYDKLKLQGEVKDLRAVEEAFVPSYQTV